MLNRIFSILLVFAALTFSSCKKKYADFKFSRASIILANGATEEFVATLQSLEADNKVDYVIESDGTKDLTISSIKLTGADASNFTLDTKTFTSGAIKSGESITLSISLKTNNAGSSKAALEIASDAKDLSTFKLNLDGSVQ